MYKIGDFAKITGASIRTLRYYDTIDLLKPDDIDIYTGYRYYTISKLEEYKKIILLKEIGFSLEEIKDSITHLTDTILVNKKEELIAHKENIDVQIQKIEYLRENIAKEMIDTDVKIKTLIPKIHTQKRIVKGNYELLLFQNGNTMKDSYLAKEVKAGSCNYYLIYEGNQIIKDFWIYKKDNHLCGFSSSIKSSRSVMHDDSVRKMIFDYLKEEYRYITVILDADEIETIQKLEELDFIFEENLSQAEYKYKKYRKKLGGN
ncbi:MAG: MerR family transcriptional regulator [Bacilli bacterium]|nr:MerR family transcriptional regulator [Bacilli bacterium]